MDTALVIVDDNLDAVQALQRPLEMAGYTVFPAVTAEAAMALVELYRPVGVILDLGMEGYRLANPFGGHLWPAQGAAARADVASAGVGSDQRRGADAMI